ncbi:hypothetical protein SAMN05216358_2994 [Rhizobium sp. AN5]|uniref:hypothetical protein n=1 Tax=Rhizobium sp. AN5 TaxID=1855304 RepID=UPI000BC9AA80|nr:hypothetical protein [Rhizobium sp. AN5]SOC92834.1 hypothetical protein SAMN05216358_2994 [Rhizobium sp. AN5]
MRFGDLAIEDVVKLALVCFGGAAATFVVYTAGYFSLVGPEFLGIYFDGNIISGIVQVTPMVTGVTSICLFLYYWIYRLFCSFDDGEKIIDFLLVIDKVLIIPIVATLFMDKDWLDLKAFILLLSAFVIAGAVFFQNMHYGVVNYLSVSFLIFTLFNAVDISGKASAYRDLTKDAPRYSLYTTDKNYVNVVVLRSTSNGVIVKSGNDIIFYGKDQIERLERDLKGIKQFKAK